MKLPQHIKNKMAYVGRFNESDLRGKKDREAIDAKKALKPNFRYIYSEFVKNGGRIVAIEVWLTDKPEFAS